MQGRKDFLYALFLPSTRMCSFDYKMWCSWSRPNTGNACEGTNQATSREKRSSMLKLRPHDSLSALNKHCTTHSAMFSLPRFALPSFLSAGSGSYPAVELPSVETHDIETAAEKRSRTLKHLIKANHANYSILYNQLRFHNHAPHVRCSDVPNYVAAKLGS
jgi:hypothetical protein